MVHMVHAVENSLFLKQPDRRRRLALTMAGGAIQGPGSVGFENEEARVDNRHGLPVGVCQFHRLDRAGYHADRQFPITLVYDRRLRLLRKSFGFGTGLVILRATAQEFHRLACLLEADAMTHSIRAAEAEAAGRPLVAERHKVARAKAAAHAMSFCRAGSTVPAAFGASSRWHEKSRVAISCAAPAVRDVSFGLLGAQDPHLRGKGERTDRGATWRPRAFTRCWQQEQTSAGMACFRLHIVRRPALCI